MSDHRSPRPTGRWAVGKVLVRASRNLQAESYWQEQIAGLDEAISAGGGDLVLKIVPDDASERATYEQWAAASRIRLVVMEDFTVADSRREYLEQLGLEVIVIGDLAEAGDRAAVRTSNNQDATRVAVQTLYDLGHRAIGHVSGPAHFSHSLARSAAFADAAAEFGITVTQALGDYPLDSGAAAARTLLAADEPVTAIVFDNDLMALGGLAQVVESGKSVPGDISIVAWDDSVRCQMSIPPLAALSHDVREVGRMAGEAVVRARTGKIGQSVAPPPIFVPRSTVGPPPTTT